jgi:small basic protein
MLVVGSLIVGYVLDVAVPDVFLFSLFVAVLGLPLATLAGLACRVQDTAELVPR